MTITESRLRKGVLTLGGDGTVPGTSFACQATNVRVTPSYADDGDPIETLCGDSKPAGKKETWVLAGTSVQDFDDPEGFLTFCFDNRMLTVPFTWKPNDGESPEYSGDVVVVALEEGGDVNSRLTTDWEFQVSGDLVRAYAAPLASDAAEAPAREPVPA
jgi:hypothetical protein